MASDYLRKKAQEQAEKIEKQYGSDAYGGTTWLNKQRNKEDDDIAPVVPKISSSSKDSYVAKTILGTADELDVYREKLSQAKQLGDSTEAAKYQYLFDQSANKYRANNYITKMSSITMDGTNRSVYEEAQIVAAMEDGDEKTKRKKALLEKIKSIQATKSKWDGWLDPFDDGVNAGEILPFLADTVTRALSFGEPYTDSLDENEVYAMLTGESRDASLTDLTWNSLTRGYNNSRYGEESFDAMNGVANEKEKYEYILADDKYNFKTDNWFEKAISGAAEQIGQQFRQYTNLRTIALTGGAAGAAAIAGQLGPQVLVPEEIVTVPVAAIAGFKAGSAASALESEAGLAYNEMLEAGISEETAKKIALGVGTVNAGLEMFQLDELLDAYKITKATGTTKTFTKRIFDELVDRGVDVAKETAQEVAQEGVTIAGTQIGSKADTGEWAYSAGEVGERLKDTAASSALSFGVLNAPAAGRNVISIANDQKKANTLTENEQKVVDKVVNDEIAKREEAGEKLTSKQKTEIYDKALHKLEKGYISVGDIESVLGGETYKTYKDTLDSENALTSRQEALQKELDDINSKPWQDRDWGRIDEIEAELSEVNQKVEDNKVNSKLGDIQKQLSDEVFQLTAKDTKLRESYNEVARRHQKIDIDPTQYSGAARKTAESIANANWNNTNAAKDAANFLIRVSSDQGIPIEALTAKEIAERGFGVEGKTVNGANTKDGIIVNWQSPKYLNSTVGHEITHVLKKHGLYEPLRDAMKAYSESKGDYQSRYDSTKDLYTKKDKDGNVVLDADGNAVYLTEDGKVDGIEEEVIADLVGDYLFTDQKFVEHLLATDENVFKKAWNEIKYFVKISTAGSDQQEKLLEAQRAFERAYKARGNAKNNTADGGVKYSIETLPDGKKYVRADRQVIFGNDPDSWSEQVESYINGKIRNGENISLVAEDGDVLVLTADTAGKISSNKTSHGTTMEDEEFFIKANAGVHIDELAQISTNDNPGKKPKADKGARHGAFAEGGWTYRTAYFQDFDGKYYRLKISAAKGTDGNVVYNIGDIEERSFPKVTGSSAKGGALNGKASSGGILPQDSEGVKGQFSLSDSEGRQLSNEQSEYFKDSKAVDENGSLKVVYHGTRNADFTVFKQNATYFTDNKEMADSYSPNGDMYEGYVNITKPYEIDAKGEKWSKIPIDDATRKFLQEYGSSVFKEGGKWRTSPADLVSAIEEAVDNGDMDYDGIIIRNVDDTGSYYKDKDSHLATDYIVFNSNQFKNADNTKPTADPDIRFSLSESVEETKDLLAVHNLTSEQVLKSLELGGLPMPSVAVLKADSVHGEYGDVSLILPKNAIDPKANKANKVYGGDAWTPVYPRIEYKPNAKVEKKISDKYYGLAREIGYDAVRPMYNYVTDLERQLNNANGEAAMLKNLYDDTDMMNLYLQDSGKGKIEAIEKETVTEISPEQAEMNQFFIDALGDEVIASYPTPKGESMGLHRRQFIEQHGEEIRAAYKRFFMERYDFAETEADNAVDNTSKADLLHIVRDAYQYTQNKGVTVKTEVDRQATEKAIRDAAADGYKEWVDDLFNGVEEKTGIRNNQDYYTRSGNPRSWDALHWENTLENVVKTMKGQEETGTTSFSPYNSFASLSHKRYGSIAEIKADSNRLGKISQEEYEAMGDSFAQRFVEIANSIKDPAERNPFIAADNAAELIVDAVRTQKTRAGMLNYLQKWNERVTEQTVEDVISLASDIANMPTGYFEAKPQRAVGFDEVAVFVIPRNADVKLKQELLNRGYSIAEYDPDVEGDRQKVVNQFEEYKFSLSNVGEQPTKHGDWHISGKDLALKDIAPVQKDVAPVSETNLFPDDLAPIDDTEERLASLDDADVPPESDAYYGEETPVAPIDPFEDRDFKEVGKRNVNAYMYDNPEVKPFFQMQAKAMLGDLQNSVKGERLYNDDVYYESGGEQGWGGTKRQTTDDIAYLLDMGYTYAQIEKGLNDIIEDNGAENNAMAKRIEFALNDRLSKGYTDINGVEIPADEDYLNVLTQKETAEAIEGQIAPYTDADAPMDDIAPVAEEVPVTEATEDVAPVAYEAIKPQQSKEPRMARATPEEQARNGNVAKILFDHQQTKKQKSAWKWAREHIFSRGAVFEDLSLKTGNRELQAKFDNIRRAESRAQTFIGEGKGNAKALVDVRKAVEKSGKTEDFNYYLYHLHNVDRMTLEQRFKDVPNKSVFGDSVDAETSRKAALGLEVLNPEFKQWADEVYTINRHLRQMMVDEGIISQETADLWQKMYPHYVPISRADAKGLNVNVPLDTKRTGINAPIKKATGGNSDFYNVFDTMGSRIEQTYKAIAKNRFGVELMNTLGTAYESDVADIDTVLETMDQHEELLQEGKNGESPSFTVFRNGERTKFAITEDMYDAMKPSQFTYTNEALKKINDIRRDILTTYSPTFALTNPIKDVQDILLNSQHPARTYATIPEAIYSVLSKNHWYQERMENGGKQDSYFDGQTKTFKKEGGWFKKAMGFVPSKIQAANEVIEQVPRMAEYIASRKMGRSIDVSMLDAARVTTNFGAPGDLTNMLNRNGFTFLGASVEGFNQQVRNVREAKAEGLKGWAKLAAKYAVAGLPALLLNHALWDDDEDYEELSDYVKQNYYVVAKTEDGKFIRIPKGRAVAVIQDAFRQMENLITGNDDVDLDSFGQLVINNLAPNNPLENNLIAPIVQAYTNKTWYGDDLVPTRLQDVPVAEQFDETTDSLSKWLGEATNTSPYKWNYLLDQYTGGFGDMVLPYLTTEADGGGLGAAFRDKFVSDPVLKNQNVSDFYDKVDELTVNANSSKATDEDVLMSKYMSSVSSKIGELYQQKREIQNSDLSDAEKYAEVRAIQQQIDDLAKEGLATYGNVNIDNGYATVGDLHYRWHEPSEDSDAEPGWQKITDKQLEKQEKVTSALGISGSEYWNNKEEYDFAYDSPAKYAVAKSVGGYSAYKSYSKELYDIKADKDSSGKSINGSRKEKVVEYINNMNADYGQKIILFKSEYPSDDTYNMDIIDYLNSRDDISYSEMETILKELGFKVDSKGNVSWD